MGFRLREIIMLLAAFLILHIASAKMPFIKSFSEEDVHKVRSLERRSLAVRKNGKPCPVMFHGPYGGFCYYFALSPITGKNVRLEKGNFCTRIGGRGTQLMLFRGGFGCKRDMRGSGGSRRALNDVESEEFDLESEALENFVETGELDRRLLSSQRCPRGFRGPYSKTCYWRTSRGGHLSTHQKRRYCWSIGGDDVINPHSYRGSGFGCFKRIYEQEDPRDRKYGRRRALNNDIESEDFELESEPLENFVETGELDRRLLSSQRCPRGFRGPYNKTCYWRTSRGGHLTTHQKRRYCWRIGGDDVINPHSYRGSGFGCFKRIYEQEDPRDRKYGRRRSLEIDENVENQESLDISTEEDDRRVLSSQRCPRRFRGPYNKTCYWRTSRGGHLTTHQKRRYCWSIGGDDVINPHSYRGPGFGCFKRIYEKDPNERRTYGRRALKNDEESLEISTEDRRVLSSQRCPRRFRGPYNKTCYWRTSRGGHLTTHQKRQYCWRIGGDDVINPHSYRGSGFGCFKRIYERDPNERRPLGRRVLDENLETEESVEISTDEENDRRALWFNKQRCTRGFYLSNGKCIYHHRWATLFWNDNQKRNFCRRIGGIDMIPEKHYRGRYFGCWARPQSWRRSLETEENLDEVTELLESISMEESNETDRRVLRGGRRKCPRGFRGPYSKNRCIYHHNRPVKSWSTQMKEKFCRRIGGRNPFVGLIDESKYKGKYFGCYYLLINGRRALEVEEEEENYEDLVFEDDDFMNFEDDFMNFEDDFMNFEDEENVEENFEEMEIDTEVEMEAELTEEFFEFEENLEFFSPDCLDGWNEDERKCYMSSEIPMIYEEAVAYCEEMNPLAEVVDFLAEDEEQEDMEADFLCSYPIDEMEALEFENPELIIDDDDEELIVDDDDDEILLPLPEMENEVDCIVETPFNGVYQKSSETTESGSPIFVEEVNGYEAYMEDGVWIFQNPEDEEIGVMISMPLVDGSETQPERDANWLLTSTETEIEGLPIDGCSDDLGEDCLTFSVGGCDLMENYDDEEIDYELEY